MINLEAPRLEVDEPQPDIGSEQILTASKIRELWSKTYNTDGKPDWSHLFPYYHPDIVFQF